MREVQFNRLPSQGSIYSNTRLGNVTLLGSGSHGKIYALTKETCLEEVPLLQLPHDIDIIAVDAFQDTYPVLGVTYFQKGTRGAEDASYLQIYSTWTHQNLDSPTTSSSSQSSSCSSSPLKGARPKEEFNASQLNTIGQQCSSFKLSFVPYHLYHVYVQKGSGTYGNVFLLSGSDNEIHTYEPNEFNMTFTEVPTKNYFPELSQVFESVPTRIQIECVNGLKKRITVCGFEDGTLKAYIVTGAGTPVWSPSMTPSEEEEKESGEHFSSKTEDISWNRKSAPIEKLTHFFEGMITSIQFYIDGFSVNAVVASSLTPTYIYTNILEENFNTGGCLKFSSRYDCVEALCVADVDFDGRAEIIVGSFGCTLLVYKFMDEVQQWVIVSIKKLPSAIFSIEFVDSCLQVVSAIGIHILKYTTGPYFKKSGIDDVQRDDNTDLSPDLSHASTSSSEELPETKESTENNDTVREDSAC